jgi:hypothetical protein
MHTVYPKTQKIHKHPNRSNHHKKIIRSKPILLEIRTLSANTDTCAKRKRGPRFQGNKKEIEVREREIRRRKRKQMIRNKREIK